MLLNTTSLYDRKNMTAPDMFNQELLQVFSKKKGNYLGVVRIGEELNFSEVDEPEAATEPEVKNINQLQLF